MTTKDITAIAFLAKLSDGRVMQIQTNSENKNTYISMIDTIEQGIRIFDKDYSDSIEIEMNK
jgi:hypothetical protein